MTLEFSRQISEIKIHENPSRRSQAVPCGRTDTHDEANSPFHNFATATKNSKLQLPTFRSIQVLLTMRAAHSSETSTWRRIQEGFNLYQHCRENLKSHRTHKTCLPNERIYSPINLCCCCYCCRRRRCWCHYCRCCCCCCWWWWWRRRFCANLIT